MNIIGDVKGKDCLLFDDIVDSGGTLCNAAEALLENGASSVTAYITHGVLSGGAVARIAGSKLQELVITDSIQPTSGRRGRAQHPRRLDRRPYRRGRLPHRHGRERIQPVRLIDSAFVLFSRTSTCRQRPHPLRSAPRFDREPRSLARRAPVVKVSSMTDFDTMARPLAAALAARGFDTLTPVQQRHAWRGGVGRRSARVGADRFRQDGCLRYRDCADPSDGRRHLSASRRAAGAGHCADPRARHAGQAGAGMALSRQRAPGLPPALAACR